MCYAYLTNQRLVFVHQVGKTRDVVGDVPLDAIEGLTSDKVFIGPSIVLSVPGTSGIDHLSVVFAGGQGDDPTDRHRNGERDKWMARIKELRDAAVNAPAPAQATAAPAEDPVQVLKVRRAKGEITPQQYEDMKKLLA
jgi:hypothetical protein